jgi:hypothetical protein
VAGNYCADIARMRKNTNCVTWLQECANGKRAESYDVLGLDGNIATVEDVRRRFIELAKVCHPDSRGGRRRRSDEGHPHQHPHQDEEHDMYDENDDVPKEEMTKNDDDFVRIRAAYEHLTKEGGVGNQRNPKYDEVKLLEDRKRIANNDNSDDELVILSSSDHGIDDNNSNNNGIIEDDDDDLFMARLIAVISDYDENCGFPVALIARRWNQIWPTRPFPTEYIIDRTVQVDDSTTTIIRKKVRLLRWLRWKRDRSKCTTVYFRNVEGVVLAFNKTRQHHEEGHNINNAIIE